MARGRVYGFEAGKVLESGWMGLGDVGVLFANVISEICDGVLGVADKL